MYDPISNSIRQKTSVATPHGTADDTLVTLNLASKPFPEARAAVIASCRTKLGLFQPPAAPEGAR
jgi:hypothetical protein